jgi:hypothetical protein
VIVHVLAGTRSREKTMQKKTGNLGQQDAQTIKEKERELSRMGEKIRGQSKEQKKQQTEDDETPE